MDFEKSLILDIVYGYEPMTLSLAQALKELRCERGWSFDRIPHGLNQGFGDDFSLGKDLCKKAESFLNDGDSRWE
jgi:hypothetical protein